MQVKKEPDARDAVEQELQVVEDELHHFEHKHINVTRTLQMVVYPSLIAFVILAAYGFYLIQSLTSDMHRLTETMTADVHDLTQTIAKMNTSVERSMSEISSTMTLMSQQMNSLVQSTDQMTRHIVGLDTSTQRMANDVGQMNASTHNMAVSTYNIQRDMWTMNRNISKPMKMFSSFIPFGSSDSTTPYVLPPPTAYYGSYYYYPQATTSTLSNTQASTQVYTIPVNPDLPNPTEAGKMQQEVQAESSTAVEPPVPEATHPPAETIPVPPTQEAGVITH